MYDLLLKGGHVIDGCTGQRQRAYPCPQHIFLSEQTGEDRKSGDRHGRAYEKHK